MIMITTTRRRRIDVNLIFLSISKTVKKKLKRAISLFLIAVLNDEELGDVDTSTELEALVLAFRIPSFL